MTLPSPGDLRKSGIKPASPVTPTLQENSLPLSHRGSPKGDVYGMQIISHLLNKNDTDVSKDFFVRAVHALSGRTR